VSIVGIEERGAWKKCQGAKCAVQEVSMMLDDVQTTQSRKQTGDGQCVKKKDRGEVDDKRDKTVNPPIDQLLRQGQLRLERKKPSQANTAGSCEPLKEARVVELSQSCLPIFEEDAVSKRGEGCE
jgi:hypothetical protein